MREEIIHSICPGRHVIPKKLPSKDCLFDFLWGPVNEPAVRRPASCFSQSLLRHGWIKILLESRQLNSLRRLYCECVMLPSHTLHQWLGKWLGFCLKNSEFLPPPQILLFYPPPKALSCLLQDFIGAGFFLQKYRNHRVNPTHGVQLNNFLPHLTPPCRTSWWNIALWF